MHRATHCTARNAVAFLALGCSLILSACNYDWTVGGRDGGADADAFAGDGVAVDEDAGDVAVERDAMVDPDSSPCCAQGDAAERSDSASLDASDVADAAEPTADAASDAAAAQTCGNQLVDTNDGEDCDPTAPGWSHWSCDRRCKIFRAYATCTSDFDCSPGRCISGTCTTICVRTMECLRPDVPNLKVSPYCGDEFRSFYEGAYRTSCVLTGCEADADCPPTQLCWPGSDTVPRSCAPQVCVAGGCPTGLQCISNVCAQP